MGIPLKRRLKYESLYEVTRLKMTGSLYSASIAWSYVFKSCFLKPQSAMKSINRSLEKIKLRSIWLMLLKTTVKRYSAVDEMPTWCYNKKKKND